MNRRGFVAGGVGMGLAGSGMASPGGQGFRVPAEDAPHELTFMQWPASRAVYDNPVLLRRAQRTIAEIANTIAAFEPVILLAAAEDHAAARRHLGEAVTLWDVPTEDLWCRDSGPIVAMDGKGTRAVTHIRFNGWGGKQVHQRDGAIAAIVAERLGLALRPTGLVGEGGGVEQDGHGLLMAHESSWLQENRNPGLSRDEITERLRAAYGAERVIWSPGLAGQDITDYHIDGLARFTRPGRVLMTLPDAPDQADPFHRAAAVTHARLIAAGLDVEVIAEPDRPRVRQQDFVASYVNHYVCNGAVIAAEFGDRETDALARSALARHYPDREILSLNVDVLGELGGGIHCATQQLPAI